MDESGTAPGRDLHEVYAAYRLAMTAWRSAAKAGDPEAAEAAADRLLHARVELYRALVGTGWEAPPAVAVQLDRDIALVEVPEDLEALLLT